MRPPGAEVIDAHTHLGLDEDGRSLTLEALLAQLDAADARRACVFPLHDPERRPAYSLPNDRVLAWAHESDGRLIPFCRLDPDEGAVAECERSLARGARGVKLHPRAQDFAFDHDVMGDVFGLAEEARVPVLIHAGRGLPPLADGLVDLALRHPGVVLILAHGAICDQGILTSRLADHPGVLYDISCFFPVDVIELFARAPAERIVFASDPPYGLPATTLYMALRVARQAGLDEATQKAVLGGTMAALIDGEDLPAATAPRRGEQIALAGRLARVYGYASLVGPALFTGAVEQARAMLEMAIAPARGSRARHGRRGAREDRRGAHGGAAGCWTPRRASGRRSTSSTARSCARRPRSATRADQPAASHSAAHSPSTRLSRIASPALPCEGGGDLVGLAREQAARDQVRRRRRGIGERSSEVEQQRAQQVRGDRQRAGVRLLAHPRERVAAQVEPPCLDRRAVRACVRRAAALHALGLVVEAQHRREPEMRGGDREHSGAGADVQQRARRLARCEHLEHQLQAQPRGRVGACAERLPGVDHHLQHARRRRAGSPTAAARGREGGPSVDRAAAAARTSTGRVELLPALLPVVGDLARGDLDERVADDRVDVGEARQLARSAVDARTRPSPARPASPRRRPGEGRAAPPARARPARGGRGPPGGSRRLAAEGATQLREHRLVGAQVLLGEALVEPSASSRCSALSRRGTTTLTTTRRSPGRPRRSEGMPSPRSVSTSPGCVPARQLDGRCALERGDLQRGAERRERRGHVEHGDQVVALAHEARVLANAHEHVEVPGGALRPRRRGPCRRGGCAGRRRYPRGCRHRARVARARRPRPAALVAGLARDAPVAVADVARHRPDHLPERRAS